jgi:hypothetical protein
MNEEFRNAASDESAPWKHPKAQRWLEILFEKSDLIVELETWVFRDSKEYTAEQIRLITVLLVILGHPGIWPEDQRERYQKLAARLHTLSKEFRAERKSAISVAEHKRLEAIHQQWELETEMLRRRADLSKRTTKLELPESWVRFWN